MTRPVTEQASQHVAIPSRVYQRVVERNCNAWLLAARMLALGLWFGLLTGLSETALMFSAAAIYGPAAMGSLQMNHHALWMITLSNVVIFLGCGVILGVLACLVRQVWITRVGVLVFGTIGFMAPLQFIKGLTLLAGACLACGLATCVARGFDPEKPRFRALIRWGTPVMLLLAIGLVGLQFCGDASRERWQAARLASAPANAPNVLLIVLDTVRADALGCYGYHRPTTPNLDRLAARAVRFAHARAPGAWTLPSHASMFTGRWPNELSARIDTPLDETYPTIAEHTRERGYATAGFVANTFYCNRWFGLGRGFTHYDDMAITLTTILRTSHMGRHIFRRFVECPNQRPTAHFNRKSATTINDEFLSWLDNRTWRDRPFFVFLNYFDVHDPYLLLQPRERGFGRRPTTAADFEMLRNWHFRDGKKQTTEQLELARDCYDDCLAEVDRQIGRLMLELESRGALEKTWIIITSDHGEQFGEHGFIGHGNSVHRSVVHVPLLIVPPNKEMVSGRVIDPPVSLRDIPATIARWIGHSEQEQTPFPGRSLSRFWDEPNLTESTFDDWVLSEHLDQPKEMKPGWKHPVALVAEGHVYIRNFDGQEALFHLVTDPQEQRDLSNDPALAEVLERFRSRLAESTSDGSPDDPGEE